MGPEDFLGPEYGPEEFGPDLREPLLGWEDEEVEGREGFKGGGFW